MAKWLQKTTSSSGGSNLPVQKQSNMPGMSGGQPPAPVKLPPAAIIYGIASALLLLMAFYHFFTGRWFTGLLVLLPAGCFMGFAWHFAKHAR